MFTFGIFTTHLPYIAFVVFYAGLWIFGNEKAAVDDIGIDEGEYFKVPAALGDTHGDNESSFFITDDFCQIKEKSFYDLYSYNPSFGQALYQAPLKEISYRFSWFSRPPPLM